MDSTLCTDEFKVSAPVIEHQQAGPAAAYFNCRDAALWFLYVAYCHLVPGVHFQYISALLLSLNTQLQLELPHVNVLSKVDMLRHHAKDLS